MLLAGIPHRPTGHGKCGFRPPLPLINYPAELSCEDVIGLANPTDFSEVTRRHTCDCPMWQGGRYVISL